MLDPKVVFETFKKHLGLSDWQKLSVENLAGDASSRQYFRLHGKKEKLTTWVLQIADKFDPANPDKNPFISGQKIFDLCGTRVPKILATDAQKGWILLEDLGDETLQRKKTKKLYQESVKAIAQWTLNCGEDLPAYKKLAKTAPHFGWAFDFEKLDFEMGFTAEHLYKNFLKLDGYEFQLATKINSRYLADCPRFFCHRDFHSRNVMIVKDTGEIAVIDFQDARMGPITYDLVSLLWDPYVPLSDNWREELLKIFLVEIERQSKAPLYAKAMEALEPAGNLPSLPRWQIELHRMIVQRMLKAAGSYASFWVKKKREDYLPSIFPALMSSKLALEALKDSAPQAWTQSDVELLTAVNYALSALPDNLKT